MKDAGDCKEERREPDIGDDGRSRRGIVSHRHRPANDADSAEHKEVCPSYEANAHVPEEDVEDRKTERGINCQLSCLEGVCHGVRGTGGSLTKFRCLRE